jgi:hypothetical protein
MTARWLDTVVPWRFRSLGNLAKANANALFRRALDTPAMPCAVGSDVEAHALVCRRDVNMMLIAAKSFLRFAGNVSLVLHDDGSLLQDNFEVLRKHLPNARVIPRAQADEAIERILPEAMAALRRRYVFLLKLFDFNHHCRGRKLITLDSDLLFLSPPHAVLSWIHSEATSSFFNQDPAETFRASANVDLTGVPRNLNAGFIGFPGPIPLDEITSAIRLLDYALEDQTIYAWLFASRQPFPLDADEYVVFDGARIPPRAAMVHFISSYRFKGLVYPRLARSVCAELQAR